MGLSNGGLRCSFSVVHNCRACHHLVAKVPLTTGPTRPPCRRAKPGRFSSLAYAMKNRHFGGECSWILAGKARKCGRFWVFACVPNPGKRSIWRQCAPSSRKQSTTKTAKSSRLCPCKRPPLKMPSGQRKGGGRGGLENMLH